MIQILTVPMSTLCDIKSGKSDTKDAVNDGEYAFFDRSKVIKKSSQYLFDCEALIIAGEGAEFLPKHFNGKFDLHQRAYALYNFSDKINVKYLYYYLHYLKDYLPSVAVGATVKSLRLRHFQNLPVTLFPISTQEKIVEKLDRISIEIEKSKQATDTNIKNSQQLFQSYLGSIFENPKSDWNSRTLKDVCEKITDGTHQTPTYFDSGVIFLSSKNVTSGKIDWERIKFIDEKQHVELSKRLSPRVGDILLAKNGTTGVAAIVDRDVVFDIYVSLALLRAKEIILPKLLLYFVNSPIAKIQFNKRLKGIGVPNLHLQEIREVEICFPSSVDEQLELVSKIESFLEVTSIQTMKYIQKKNEIINLWHSVLTQAFNGNLVKE